MAVNLCWSTLLFVGILQAGGKMQTILGNFEAEPSWIYQIASSTPFLLTVPTLALLALAKEWFVRKIRLKIWTNLVHTFVILVIQAVAVAGFFQPLFQLLDRLS